jgi:ABC-2 type transport system ATP-binding protein
VTDTAGLLPLAARGLSRRYGHRWALRDVNLGVPAGTVTALVGPNGAGKSTLLQSWVGFVRPTSGVALVFGNDPTRDRRRCLERVAYLPQHPALYRDLSVRDHFDIAAHERPGFVAARAHATVERLRIDESAKIHTLSGGELAHVSLAITMGMATDILVLDEPLASLDPLARLEFLAIAREAARERGLTVLLSSHNIDDVEHQCDRIVILAAGEVALDAPIADIAGVYRIVSDPVSVPSVDIVGVLPTGEAVSRSGDGRAATVREVVLAHLVRARSLPHDEALAE